MSMTRRNRAAAFAVAGVCGLLPGLAGAVCQIRSTMGVSFGTYLTTDLLPRDSAGSITYRCEGQLTPITIDFSAGSSGNPLARSMAGPGAHRLEYNLYVDATRLIVWGNGTSGTGRYGPVVPLFGVDVTVPIYGRIPAGQAIPVGAYADTVVMTVTF
ncbi:spore coat protein U domain-containing protein [Myxococcus xanthus]|uniref:Spore coat protein U domain-containing protein n=2 Tax=Myxococcus xanthus TaxID=34 RepID=A0A7Y4MU99_MYXXA|nr:spore coat protein U domain-containing protein [Myxococcus xanthus]NOJ90298.1 spore coat protein U domain-containing protein [Myxococcus xanthus]